MTYSHRGLLFYPSGLDYIRNEYWNAMFLGA